MTPPPSNPTHCAFALLERHANEAATGNNSRPHPTEAQAAAGNYKMGRVRVQGLDIRVENVRGSVRSGTSPDGKTWSNRMAAHYGYIAGTRGADGDEVDVFVGPLPESESVWVINQRDAKGSFDEHKVMVGFATEDQARSAYLHSYDRNWRGLQSIVPASLTQLKWWLRNGNKARAISPDQLPHEGESTMDQVRWSSAADPLNTTLPRVLYDMRRDDSGGLLLDACTIDDLMTDPDIEGRAVMDAMVVEVGMLQRKMEQLSAVMKASAAAVQPTDFTIADPVKMRGTMQIAVVFAMDDGQAVTVWFHNPDTTPNKLTPMDELVSWKWMLNKKDVTIVVAPERGRDLNAREVARRIMKLVEKNTEAFKRANARSAELAAQHAAIDAEIPVLEAQVAKLQDEVAVARIAKGDGEVLPIAPSAVNPVAPATAKGKKSLPPLAQELADVFRSQGYDAYREASSKVVVENDLDMHQGLDLQRMVTAIVGPTVMELARAKFDPATEGKRAHGRGESALPPEGLSEEQRALWLAGWDEMEEDHPQIPAGPAALSTNAPGEVVGEATETPPQIEDSQPAVEIDTGAYDGIPEDAVGIVQMREIAVAAMLAMRDEAFDCPALEASVTLRMSGINKFKSFATDPRKIKIAAGIGRLLGTAKFVKREPNYNKAKSPNIVAFHLLRAKARMGGEEYAVRFKVGEDDKGLYHWDCSVHEANAVFDAVQKGEEPTGVSSSVLAGGNRGCSQNRSALPEPDRLLPTEPSAGHQDGFILDDAGSVVNSRSVLNLFIEGEAPEDLGADGPATPAQIVDSAYLFVQATERFKEYIAETVSEADYSMFATAKGIDEAAKARGASVSWDVEDVGVMDSVNAALDSVSYSVKVVFNEETPVNMRQFGAKQACFVDWGIYGGVALVEATAEDRAEFGGGTFRIGKGQTQNESIVRVDPKGMRLYFLDNQRYADTMEVKWDTPVSLKRLIVQNKEKFEAAYRAPVLDGVALDKAGADSKRAVVGRIFRDGLAVGVATVAGDGKAMIYVGGLGGDRVKDPNGLPAPRGSDPEYLVKWLLEPTAGPAPEPEPTPAIEDGNIAVLRSILAGESDSAHLSLTLATIEACVNALNDSGLLTGEVEQLAQDVITYWATLDEKVNG